MEKTILRNGSGTRNYSPFDGHVPMCYNWKCEVAYHLNQSLSNFCEKWTLQLVQAAHKP